MRSCRKLERPSVSYVLSEGLTDYTIYSAREVIMTWSLRTLLLTGATGAACVLAQDLLARQSTTKTLYVTALDNKGVPITDLGPAEVEAKAGGTSMENGGMKPGKMLRCNAMWADVQRPAGCQRD